MAYRARTIGLFVALTVAALLGLLTVQALLLQAAMEQKDQAFRRNVTTALAGVVQKLEAREAVGKVFATVAKPPAGKALPRGRRSGFRLSATSAFADSLVLLPSGAGAPPMRVQGNKVFYSVRTPQRVFLRLYDPAADRDTVLVDTFKTAGEYEAVADPARFGGSGTYYRFTTDSSSFFLQITTGTQGHMMTRVVSGDDKQALVNRVVDRLVIGEQAPIEQRVRSGALDSLITTGLREAGISLPYAFGILAAQEDSLRIMQPRTYARELHASDLRARLFPADLFSPRNDLVLFFPDQKTFVLRQMWPLFAATLLFMLIIVAGFIYTVHTIVMQKRLAVLMTDFINNMTHEFKTPISTVALAAEAILRPEIMARPEKLRQYDGIILDENARMRKQVEKILQMAVLERGDYELHIADVDLHEEIRRAAASLALQLEARRGQVECRLEAAEHWIAGDQVHLANILQNLLDNAVKYSPEAPRITIGSRNRDETIVVTVHDRGIGIKPEHLKKVFEKFYRVPTGNLHDVKGFGLGLSYVKLMVGAMHGNVSITSEYGKGTQVELAFPVRHTTPGTA